GETREQRIKEFLVVNKDTKVLGLREGTYLNVYDEKIWLKGKKSARLFNFYSDPIEINPSDDPINI
nr:dipeptidase PepE [Bacteroidales bacterium]